MEIINICKSKEVIEPNKRITLERGFIVRNETIINNRNNNLMFLLANQVYTTKHNMLQELLNFGYGGKNTQRKEQQELDQIFFLKAENVLHPRATTKGKKKRKKKRRLIM